MERKEKGNLDSFIDSLEALAEQIPEIPEDVLESLKIPDEKLDELIEI